MEKQKTWRELFSKDAKIDNQPPLWAIVANDGKLKLKIPQVITNQNAIRGKLSLIGIFQGVQPNIEDVRRCASTNGILEEAQILQLYQMITCSLPSTMKMIEMKY